MRSTRWSLIDQMELDNRRVQYESDEDEPLLTESRMSSRRSSEEKIEERMSHVQLQESKNVEGRSRRRWSIDRQERVAEVLHAYDRYQAVEEIIERVERLEVIKKEMQERGQNEEQCMCTLPVRVRTEVWVSKKRHLSGVDQLQYSYDPVPFAKQGVIENPQGRVFIHKRLHVCRGNRRVAGRQLLFHAKQSGFESIEQIRESMLTSIENDDSIEKQRDELRVEEMDSGADPLKLGRVREQLQKLQLAETSQHQVKSLDREIQQLDIEIGAQEQRLKKSNELRKAARSNDPSVVSRIEEEMVQQTPAWVVLQQQTVPHVPEAVIKLVYARRKRAQEDKYRKQQEYEQMVKKWKLDGRPTEGEVAIEYNYAQLQLEKLSDPQMNPVEETNWDEEIRK